MNHFIFSDSELLGFTKTSLVLYVEDSYNPELNNYIQSNFKQIVEYYLTKEIDFCYLPYLFHNEKYIKIVNYNRPYLKDAFEDKLIAEIYKQILIKQTKPLKGAGLVLFETFYGNKGPVLSFPINENNGIIEQFHKFANAIYEVFTEEEKFVNNIPSFKRTLPEDSTDKETHFMSFDPKVEDSSTDYDIDVRFMTVQERSADSKFDYEAFKLVEEIRTRIQLLRESGSLSLIGDILEEIQGETKKLSTIFITNDYRIFLKDYGMKEVVMSPLPKSVFILFLHHPEGILFKQLANYHDELLSIYRNMTVHENIDQVIESIKSMTDPLNNSINEKCSRIRAGFLEIITDDLAKNYYVTGYRGEPKKIILDRSMVEFQK